METRLEVEELQTTRRHPFCDGCLLGVLELYLYGEVDGERGEEEARQPRACVP